MTIIEAVHQIAQFNTIVEECAKANREGRYQSSTQKLLFLLFHIIVHAYIKLCTNHHIMIVVYFHCFSHFSLVTSRVKNKISLAILF